MAKWFNATDCGSVYCGFESRYSPKRVYSLMDRTIVYGTISKSSTLFKPSLY